MVTGTDSTFSPTVPSEDLSFEWSVCKPLQNEENGETISGDSEGENDFSTSLTDFESQNGLENDPVSAQDFSKKSEKIFQKNFQNDNLLDSRKESPSDIVKNAPWPFSAAGGKEEASETPSSVSPVPAQPLVPQRTVAVVERQGNSAKKRLSPSEKDLKPTDLAQSPAPAPASAPRQVAAAAAVALDPEPVLPPGYHVAPRGNRNARPLAPVPASHEVPEMLLSPAPPQEIALPTLPPVEAEIQDFPPIEEKTLEDFPPMEESPGPGLLRAPTLEEENAEMTPENKLQAPIIINEGTQGNFPMAYGEMELVKPNGYFGAEKPVTIPSVPEEKEGANDLLTIDAVVDLPESESPRAFPPVEE